MSVKPLALLTLCAAMVLAALPASAADESAWDARLTRIEGEVIVYTADDPDGIPAEKDMPLEPGDRIGTGSDGTAEVALDPDSVIEVGPGSELKIESTKKSDSVFGLNFGLLKAKIKLLMMRDKLRVRTPTSVSAVRGTEFAMQVEEEGDTHVGVFDEGKVSVGRTDEDSSEVSLENNQETSVRESAAPLPPQALKRFIPARARIVFLRDRVKVLRQDWKTLSREKRLELRRLSAERFRENMKNDAKLRKKWKKQSEKRKGEREKLRKKVQKKYQKNVDQLRRRQGGR